MTVLITVLSVAVVESVRQQPKHRLTIISRLVVVVVIQLFLIFLTGWSVGVAFVPGTLLLIIAAILFWLMPQSTIPGSA
jgi:F0F1-type ATP synthase assembly protein I